MKRLFLFFLFLFAPLGLAQADSNLISTAASGGSSASSFTPTNTPTPSLTLTSTKTATNTRTLTPTKTPTNTRTNTPTKTPTNTRTNSPTVTPTNTLTGTHTPTPTLTPTNTPNPCSYPYGVTITGTNYNYSGNAFESPLTISAKVSIQSLCCYSPQAETITTGIYNSSNSLMKSVTLISSGAGWYSAPFPIILPFNRMPTLNNYWKFLWNRWFHYTGNRSIVFGHPISTVICVLAGRQLWTCYPLQPRDKRS